MTNQTIEIETNPAGYSDGCYGYIIRTETDDGVESMTCDGGYASPELARAAARRRAAEVAR